jgi:hypothetical protein
MIVDLNEEDDLVHYGVKGMRWGVRKSRPKSKADLKREAKDVREKGKRKSAAKNRRNLSDADLEKYVQRLEKEKKLKSLIDNDVEPGKTVVKQILGDSGKKVLGTAIAGVGIYAVRAALQGKFDPKEAAGHLKPKK